MNKKEAERRARSGEITIKELRDLIANSRGRGGVSRVNPMFTKEQALDIYEKALGDRLDDEKPAGMKPDLYSRTGRMKPTGDSLLIKNILRDCA